MRSICFYFSAFAMMTAKSRSYELQTDLLKEHELKNDCVECPVITNQNMKISKITIRYNQILTFD